MQFPWNNRTPRGKLSSKPPKDRNRSFRTAPHPAQKVIARRFDR